MCRKMGIYKLALFFTAAFFIIAGGVSAGETVIEGKIKGASCVINGTVCPESSKDPRLVLERDFVLVTGNGDYFFLSNVNRLVKEGLVNKDVKITGKIRDGWIFVGNVDVMRDQRYEKAWNWDERIRALSVPR